MTPPDQWVVQGRNQLDPALHEAPPLAGAAGLRGGRLLVFEPDESLDDGAAELETGGSFDAHNCPPWDTWIAVTGPVVLTYGPGSLISWVPPEFVAVVGRGIDVNPEGCLMWLEDSGLFASDPRRWAPFVD